MRLHDRGCYVYIRTPGISAQHLGGRRLSGGPNHVGIDSRISATRPLRFISIAALVAVALALLLASVPTSRAAGIAPPDLVLTFTGVQLDDRIAYALAMENRGDLPAMGVTITADLSPGLALAPDSAIVFPLSFSRINAAERVQVAFTLLIDPRVAAGTIGSVTVFVAYKAPGAPETIQRSASSNVPIAARGGVPVIALIGAIAGGVLLFLGYAWKVHGEGVKIDQLFLLHDSGMLIRHYSNGRGLQRDSDIMSGMLIVLQEFVRDSFNDPRGSLEEVRFGQQRVLMARGRHSIMAAVVTGKRLNGLPVRLRRAVAGFEETHMDALSRWNGNLETLDSADVVFRSVLSPRYRGFAPT